MFACCAFLGEVEVLVFSVLVVEVAVVEVGRAVIISAGRPNNTFNQPHNLN